MYNTKHTNTAARLMMLSSGQFSIAGATPGYQDDGDIRYKPDGSYTWCSCDLTELESIAPRVAEAARGANLENAWFTTAYGDLIALDAPCGTQIAVWSAATGWEF